jgi:predicted DNA-binding transcriptional regulator YafY
MYHPTGRVLTVLELLQSRPGMTGHELADRLETDVRTVRRYIAKLQDVGIPVESQPGRYGGYKLRPGFKLPPLIFSEAEAVAIVLGLLGSSWLELEQPPEAIEGALSKITRVLPDAVRERILARSSVMYLSPRSADGKPNASLLLLLGDAIQSRSCIDLQYRSEQEQITRRIVEPYGLVGHRGKWYLVGYCRLRKDFRTFRLDRIRETVPVEERFVRKEDFDFRSYAMQQLIEFPIRWKIEVVFKATMTRVRERIPSTLGTLTETPEGVLLEWPTDSLFYVARYLIGREMPFVVKSPPELRAELRKIAEEVSRMAEAE